MTESITREDQPSALPVDLPIDVPGETPPEMPTDRPVPVPSDVPFDPPGDVPPTDDREGVPLQRPPVEPDERPEAPLA